MEILPGSLPKAREYLLIMKKGVKSRCMSLLFHPVVLFRPAVRKDGESCWFCSRAWPTSRFIISFYGRAFVWTIYTASVIPWFSCRLRSPARVRSVVIQFLLSLLVVCCLCFLVQFLLLMVCFILLWWPHFTSCC